MRCAWQAYLNLLPPRLRKDVDNLGRDTLQELRLRLNMPPELVTGTGSRWLTEPVSAEDLKFCVNIASRYSPWAAATSADGYITAQGGHRIGLCGEATVSGSVMTGISSLTSLCLRVARDFPGIARKASALEGSVLILGRPGSGKTTLLRDLIRQRSDKGQGSVAVVDERRELFPVSDAGYSFPIGKCTDVLSGSKKSQGIEAVLRSMGPATIAVDEITAQEDCQALIHAGWCGVELMATAHASSLQELYTRPVYKPIVQSRLFETVIILRPDKSWYLERMKA